MSIKNMIWNAYTNYNYHFPSSQRIIVENRSLELAGDLRNKIVGVIGCGHGFFSRRLIKSSGFVYGLDIRKKIIKNLKKHEKKNLKFVPGDAQKLPFKNNSFDALFCLDVLEHIKNDEKVIKEIRRVLKPGGFVILNVPNKEINFDFSITKLYRKIPGLKNIHILASENKNNLKYFDKALGHVRRGYDMDYFKKIKSMKIIGKRYLFNKLMKRVVELTMFKDYYGSNISPLKLILPYMLTPFFLLDDIFNAQDKRHAFALLIKMRKVR